MCAQNFRDFGNPNQPNFSYIPRTATSASNKLGPGYGDPVLVKNRVAGVTVFSRVPRFDQKTRVPARRALSPQYYGREPTDSYIKKFQEWNQPHFSRRISPTKRTVKPEANDSESAVRTGSPVYGGDPVYRGDQGYGGDPVDTRFQFN